MGEILKKELPPGGTTGQVLSKASNANRDVEWSNPSGGGGTWGTITGNLGDQTDLAAALSAKQDLITANNNQFIYQDAGSNIVGLENWYVDPTYKGLRYTPTLVPDNLGQQEIHANGINVVPLQDSPSENFTLYSNNVNLDLTNTGFEIGTNGRALSFFSNNVNNVGKSDMGEIVFSSNYFNVGNGTDPITLRGFSYSYGFGNVNDQVQIVGPIQGYGFQPQFDNSVTLDVDAAYANPFYDSINAPGTSFGFYTSFSCNANLGSIADQKSFTGVNINPTIGEFLGNSGATGINITGDYGDFDTGGFSGIYISPTISSVNFANGLAINMSNVTGTNVKAMDIVGDVSINGALAFTGALSIGQLQAFYSSNPVTSVDGTPQVLHGLTTAMTALNGETVANADAIGVSTAMLITLEEDSTTTSGAFGLGFAALALPCVVETQTNSYLDFMNCAVYAANFSGTSTGGEIDVLNLCRTVAVPNGITQVNELRAYRFDLPFGDVGTDIWGVDIVPQSAQNHFGGSVNIGSPTRKVSNSSVALEIGSVKAFLNSRLTTAERDGLTALNGMQIYNTTTDKLQVYSDGSWVDLH